MTDLQQCSLSLDDAFGIYILHCKFRRFRKSTIVFYERRTPRFIVWLAQRKANQLHLVNKNHIRAYLVDLQGDDGRCLAGRAVWLASFFVAKIGARSRVK